MSEPRVTLFSFSFRHHGRFSSFHRLLHYSQNCRVIDATFPFGKYLNRTWHERFERRWLRWREQRLRPIFSRSERQCVHYIYPENSLFEGDLWKGKHALVLSCHQPGESLREIAQNPSFANFFRALREAERVVLLSSNAAKDYEQFCKPQRLMVIPHGIDTSFFQPPASKPERRLVLTVGNWLRDYALWAEVAIRLGKKLPDVEFVVTALPATVAAVRARVEEALGTRVRFLHGLSDLELRDLYQQAAVVFLPLRDASANNALLEGMACGVPVLVSDLPATREYAADSALYFKPGATDECLIALEQLLSEPQRRADIGAAARRRATSELAWEVIAKRYAHVYAELLDAGT
jgi:glycosyltransferase involved in cell wall biosynthesis